MPNDSRFPSSAPSGRRRRRRIAPWLIALAVALVGGVALGAWRLALHRNPYVPPLEITALLPWRPNRRTARRPNDPGGAVARSRRLTPAGAAWWAAAAIGLVLVTAMGPAATAAAPEKHAGDPCPVNAIGSTATGPDGVRLVCRSDAGKTRYQPVGSSTGTASRPAGSGAAASSRDPRGSWTVGPGSVAGYRIQELVAGRKAKNPAVGRTDHVRGAVEVDRRDNAWIARNASVTVDMTSLRSNDAKRDAKLKTAAIESDSFPEARFVTRDEILLPTSAASGATATVTVKGDLTLHGVTKRVDVPVKASLEDGQLQVLVSMRIRLADYGIVPPSIAGVVTVDDNAVLEALLVMSRV